MPWNITEIDEKGLSWAHERVSAGQKTFKIPQQIIEASESNRRKTADGQRVRVWIEVMHPARLRRKVHLKSPDDELTISSGHELRFRKAHVEHYDGAEKFRFTIE